MHAGAEASLGVPGSSRLAEGSLTSLRGGEEPSRVRSYVRAVFGMKVETWGPVGSVGMMLEEMREGMKWNLREEQLFVLGGEGLRCDCQVESCPSKHM